LFVITRVLSFQASLSTFSDLFIAFFTLEWKIYAQGGVYAKTNWVNYCHGFHDNHGAGAEHK